MCCHVFGILTEEQQAVKDAYKPSDCERKNLFPKLLTTSFLATVKILLNFETAKQSSELFQLIVDADFYIPGKPLLGGVLFNNLIKCKISKFKGPRFFKENLIIAII